MGAKTVILFVLGTVACATAFRALIPDGNELMYEYRGIIKAGTHIPKAYASSFLLTGHLYMQRDKNTTYMQYKDMKMKMANGRVEAFADIEGNELPLPAEMADLEKPFKVIYDENDMAMGIVVGEKEENFVINMKKAMGLMLQINMEKIQKNIDKPYAFHHEEPTIFGDETVYYNIIPRGTDSVRVEKMQEIHSNVYNKMVTNIQPDLCKAHYEEPLTRDNQKIYDIGKHGGDWLMESMTASGGVYYTAFKGNSDAFHVYTHQTLEFVSSIPAVDKITLESEKYLDTLDYSYTDLKGAFVDFSKGRRMWDMEKLLPQVTEMIQDIEKYIKEHHLTDEQPEIKRDHLINRLTRLMLLMDTSTLDKLHDGLTKEQKEIYYQMLPLIGTQASMYNIKKLIKSKKVKDRVAVDMLHKMPFHVKQPSKKLILDWESVLTWDENEYSLMVREALVLSFSTLIHKGVQTHERIINKETPFWHWHYQHMEDKPHTKESIDEIYPSEKEMEKYVAWMVDKVKTSDNYKMKLIYLQGLRNIRIPLVLKLIPGVRGEWFEDSYLRIVALIAISPLIKNDEGLLFDVCWPIMSDQKLPLSLRITVYTLIMESQPSLQRLINMFWHMENESSNEMYMYHYDYMKATSKSTDPCKEIFRENIKKVMRYSAAPEYSGITGYYLTNYEEEKYGYGSSLDMMMSQSPFDSEVFMMIGARKHMNNFGTSPFRMYLRIKGMDKSIFNDLKIQTMNNPKAMFNYMDILKSMLDMSNNKELQINMMIMHYGQIVSSHYFNNENMKDLMDQAKSLFQSQFSHQHLNIYYPMSTTILIPTEMGFPALHQAYIPTVQYNQLKISKTKGTLNVNALLKGWSHGRIGLVFYNPVADVWQGINKYNTYNSMLPINIDITMKPEDDASLLLSWKRMEKAEDSVIGLRSHVQTMVFIKDDLQKNLLKMCRAKDEDFAVLSNGVEEEEGVMMFDEDIHHGYKVFTKLFDSERTLPLKSMDHFLEKEQPDLSMEIDDEYDTDILPGIAKLLTYIYIQPFPAKNGFLFRMEPSAVYAVTSNDLTLSFTQSYKPGEFILMPEYSNKISIFYSAHNGKENIFKAGGNFWMKTNSGSTETSFGLDLSSEHGDTQDIKVCMTGKTTWHDDHLTAEISFGMVGSEPKCSTEKPEFSISFKGMQTNNQMRGIHHYLSCSSYVWSDFNEPKSLYCFMDHTSIRNITLVLTPGHTTAMKKLESFTNKLGTTLDESMHLNVVFPEMQNSLQIVHNHPRLSSPKTIPLDDDIETNSLLSNLHYNSMFIFMHELGLTDICLIDRNSYDNGTETRAKMANQWTLYTGLATDTSKHGLWLKNVEETEKIAMKLQHNDHVMMVEPTDTGFKITVDGTELDKEQYLADWMSYIWIKDAKLMTIIDNHLGRHMVFDGKNMHIETPRSDVEKTGLCYS